MITTRCKFSCDSKIINNYGHGDTYTYTFSPVCSSEEGTENKRFWDATPCGAFEISGMTNDPEFEVGKEYYLDLSLAE